MRHPYKSADTEPQRHHYHVDRHDVTSNGEQEHQWSMGHAVMERGDAQRRIGEGAMELTPSETQYIQYMSIHLYIYQDTTYHGTT